MIEPVRGAVQLALFPVVSLTEVHPDQANALITEWGHELGACNRPFGQQGWVLDIDGRPVSVAMSASTVSDQVSAPASLPVWLAGPPGCLVGELTYRQVWRRGEIVELARQCSPPGNRWANRVMLRLWREVCARRWPYWPVRAAISYQLNARHDGAMYRFDGWRKLTETAGAECGPGATWSVKRAEGDPRSGRKTLWLWEWPDVETG
jgi:hypothetical protein